MKNGKVIKRTIIIFCLIIVGILFYEMSFRFCAYNWGEVNTDTNPFSLYFSGPIDGSLIKIIFYPREKIRLGKIKLSRGSGAYFEGKKFYRKVNSSWECIERKDTKKEDKGR
ncbi:MAG: hypothetical protein U9R52_02905 [Candidatus Omnitrophota bacterium]|nr:hypothetical protein [Candidatus Omnitrophota bacterium]